MTEIKDIIYQFAQKRKYDVYTSEDPFILTKEYSGGPKTHRKKTVLVISFGDDCLMKTYSRDEIKTDNHINIEESKYYNDFVFRSYPNKAKFIIFVRIRNPCNIELILSDDIIHKFITCGYLEQGNDRVVQYIGYSHKNSYIDMVTDGVVRQSPVYSYSSFGMCPPPPGVNYHVVSTKRVMYRKDLGYRHYHFSNGTQFGDEDVIYEKYSVIDGKRYSDESNIGGDENFDVFESPDHQYFPNNSSYWEQYYD